MRLRHAHTPNTYTRILDAMPILSSQVKLWIINTQCSEKSEQKCNFEEVTLLHQRLKATKKWNGLKGFVEYGSLCTIFIILLTLWNSEQKNGLLIKLFCFSFDFYYWCLGTVSIKHYLWFLRFYSHFEILNRKTGHW